MGESFDVIIPFESNLQNDIQSYEAFINLYHELNTQYNKRVLLDFSKVTFISANLLAVMGCCVDNTLAERKHKITLFKLHSNIKRVMRKNGFNRYFTWDDLDDTYHSTMDYKIFKANTEELVDFEKYLQINIFSRNDLPIMNGRFQTEIIDNFLEMFNNVIDHSGSNCAYVCGQYFPKSSNLTFTIVDIGKTIFENVSRYIYDTEQEMPNNCLQWALQQGNSTKDEPGGLGLSVLMDFLRINRGEFILLSGNESYCLRKKKEKYQNLNMAFPGTIVTITINLSDESIYLLDSDKKNMIVF